MSFPGHLAQAMENNSGIYPVNHFLTIETFMQRFIILIFVTLPFTLFTQPAEKKSACQFTPQGAAIDWTPGTRLKWSDFRAPEKRSPGFAVATSTCGFGYEAMQTGDRLKVNVYVRFYCDESWRNPAMRLKDVLQHEQLHFDICELYGRKFYAGILKLRDDHSLTRENMDELLSYLREEYNSVQESYDMETDHSTNIKAQHRWERMVSEQLARLDRFAGYKEF